MSLITPNRLSLAAAIRSTCRRSWSGRLGLSFNKPANPITLVSGVLSSWLMLARNSDLARAPASARSRASTNSSSSILVAVTSRTRSWNSMARPSASRVAVARVSNQRISPVLVNTR